MQRASLIINYLLPAILLSGSCADASDHVADFYLGKVITVYVGFPPGGGYDIYSRVFAAHFGRHVPGKPTVIVRNMIGGSGVRAAGYISTVTPQDGTSLGMFLDGLTLGKVLGGPGDFDPLKLIWIGRIASTATVAVAWHSSPALTIAEAKIKETVVAASVPTSTSSIIPIALNHLIGTKFKVIRGFQGSPQQALALERGEVHAIGSIAWEALRESKQSWLQENKIRILYTQGTRRITDLPNDPAVVEFAVDQKSRDILRLISVGPEIGRSLSAEPGIPSERAEALRVAFMRTMSDPDFIAEIRTRKLDIEPLAGDQVQTLVSGAMATPQALVSQVSRYMQ